MPDEARKAMARRQHDPQFAARYFVGVGLDVGGGEDGLEKQADTWPLMTSCRTWDVPDGDGQFLETVPANAYDFVHASHSLEHMADPQVALAHWVRVTKPGGYLIITVPDEDMYEQGVFPSTYNGDHKYTFTPWKLRSWSTRSVNVLVLLQRLGAEVEVIKVESLQATYDWQASERRDQTQGDAECAIEIILRKRPQHEQNNGGRFGAWHLTA